MSYNFDSIYQNISSQSIIGQPQNKTVTPLKQIVSEIKQSELQQKQQQQQQQLQQQQLLLQQQQKQEQLVASQFQVPVNQSQIPQQDIQQNFQAPKVSTLTPLAKLLEPRSEQQMYQTQQNINAINKILVMNIHGNNQQHIADQQKKDQEEKERQQKNEEVQVGLNQQNIQQVQQQQNQQQQQQQQLQSQKEEIIQRNEEYDTIEEPDLYQYTSEQIEVEKDFKIEEKFQIFFQGYCQCCQKNTRVVYGCYKNMIPCEDCKAKYCFECLLTVYKTNMILVIQEETEWYCPYRQEKEKNPSFKPSLHYQNYLKRPPLTDEYIEKMFQQKEKKTKNQNNHHQLFKQYQLMKNSNFSSTQSHNRMNKESTHMTKIQLKQKIKKLIEFNGSLIARMNQTSQIQLNDDEIIFYNSIVYNNLKVLANLSERLTIRGKFLIE